MTCKCCCFIACFWWFSFFLMMSWKPIGCSHLFCTWKTYLFLASKIVRFSPLESPLKKASTFSPSFIFSLDFFLTFSTLFTVLVTSSHFFLSLTSASIALILIFEGFYIGFIVITFATIFCKIPTTAFCLTRMVIIMISTRFKIIYESDIFLHCILQNCLKVIFIR